MNTSANILDSYVRSAPSAQNAVDIFGGEWSSRFPGDLGVAIRAGQIPLFEDSRIQWAINQLGGIAGFRVLELGPLEGGHSYMLERNGASHVLAIESNTRAYLKCLISKELLGLHNVAFVCGDFIEYLTNTTEHFDMILASGVLYHMRDPVNLISLVAQHTSRVYIWTHYWDKSLIASLQLTHKFSSQHAATVKGFPHTLYRQEYRASLQHPGFCGGSHDFSHWMNRQDILNCLNHFGFKDVRIAHEQPDHQNGPCFGLVALK